MGDSFLVVGKYVQDALQADALAAGSLGATETYRNVAVSGQNMNYIATTEWTNATSKSVKVVILNGGALDCQSVGPAACTTCAGTFQSLLNKMALAGVQDVIYTRYPDLQMTALKDCVDATMPDMQTACEGSTSPRCHWVDLRTVWVATTDTADGANPNTTGGKHVADLIWSEMVKDCIAQ